MLYLINEVINLSNRDIIKKENIKLNVYAKDWKGAVREAGNLLLSSEYINEEYIEDMVKAVEDLGPYIVIVPHIAIAHARPTNEVLKNGMSLITLEKPVEFGSEDNDPVDMVFAFCARSKENHLEALQELVGILDNEKKIERLRNIEDIEEAYYILNRK